MLIQKLNVFNFILKGLLLHLPDLFIVLSSIRIAQVLSIAPFERVVFIATGQTVVVMAVLTLTSVLIFLFLRNRLTLRTPIEFLHGSDCLGYAELSVLLSDILGHIHFFKVDLLDV